MFLRNVDRRHKNTWVSCWHQHELSEHCKIRTAASAVRRTGNNDLWTFDMCLEKGFKYPIVSVLDILPTWLKRPKRCHRSMEFFNYTTFVKEQAIWRLYRLQNQWLSNSVNQSIWSSGVSRVQMSWWNWICLYKYNNTYYMVYQRQKPVVLRLLLKTAFCATCWIIQTVEIHKYKCLIG